VLAIVAVLAAGEYVVGGLMYSQVSFYDVKAGSQLRHVRAVVVSTVKLWPVAFWDEAAKALGPLLGPEQWGF
jgi:hypothetical protein